MPRIRTVKPEFFTSEAIAAIRRYRARLTFIGLWTHCDDQGRCRDNPRLIKAAVWPLDDDVTVADVEDDLAYLAQCGRVQRYQGTPDGSTGPTALLAVVNFREHQYISKPTASRLPAPPPHAVPDPDDPHAAPHATAPLHVPRDPITATPRRGVRESSGSPTGHAATSGNADPVALPEGSGSGPVGLPVGKEVDRDRDRDRDRGGNARGAVAAPAAVSLVPPYDDAPPARCRRHTDLPHDDPGPSCVGCRSVRLARDRAAEIERQRAVQAQRDAERAAQLAARAAPRPVAGRGVDEAYALLGRTRRAATS